VAVDYRVRFMSAASNHHLALASDFRFDLRREFDRQWRLDQLLLGYSDAAAGERI
jgi:hypothetical protein